MLANRTAATSGDHLRREAPSTTDPQALKAAVRFWRELANWTDDDRLAEALRAGADQLADAFQPQATAVVA